MRGHDPQTKQAVAAIRAHYPNAPDDLSAILKYMARISQHSKEEDNDHTKLIKDLEQRISNLEKTVKGK